MKIRLSLVLFVLLLFAAAWAVSVITGYAAAPTAAASDDEVARTLIAQEKASVEAWKRKDKGFYERHMADDATYFSAMSPYLDTDPKENFLPKFDQYAEMFKVLDFQMYNPRVQVFGDTAVLSYNSASTVNMGGRVLSYTAKMTSVYARRGGAWRFVHGHESMNPGAQ